MSNTLPTESHENCEPIFHTSPRTLLELASLRLALQMWLEKFDQMWLKKFNLMYPFLPTNSYVNITDSQFMPEMESLTKVPITIRKMVESWFPVIVEELQLGVDFMQSNVYKLERGDIIRRLDLVVFGGNGRMHFKNTIENFCKDGSLSNLTKFEMACVYCMEEKIDTFWPLVCDSFRIVKMDFHVNFLMYYWICRKRGELSRISFQQFGCIEHLMINKCSSEVLYPPFLAIEYFLTLLDRDCSLNQIDRLLYLDYRNTALIKYLLPYFETSIQRQVVDRNPLRILFDFVKHRLFDYGIQTWLHVRNFISNEQFYANVIKELLSYRNGYYNRIRIQPSYNSNYVFYEFPLDEIGYYNRIGSRPTEISSYVYYESVLAEIWFHSPRHLKKFILDFHFLDICLEMTQCNRDILKNLCRDISFLLAMLSDADIDSRRRFWDENWPKWILNVPPAHLERLMALCLVNTEAIDEFKKHLKESHFLAEYFDTLVARGYHNALDDFLSYLCGDEREKLNFKMKLLTTNEHWNKCFFKRNIEKDIQEYSDLIDITLSSKTLAEDFKYQFITPENNSSILYRKLYHKSFSDIKIIVEMFLSSEKRAEMKEIFLTKFRDMITKGALHNFDGSDCENFLMWCAEEDEQRVRNFVKSLPIEGIFEAAVLNCMNHGLYNANYGSPRFVRKCSLKYLNKFLEWYFESTSLSETFKRERIQVYEGMLEAEIEGIFGLDKDSIVEEMKKELLICNVEGGAR